MLEMVEYDYVRYGLASDSGLAYLLCGKYRLLSGPRLLQIVAAFAILLLSLQVKNGQLRSGNKLY